MRDGSYLVLPIAQCLCKLVGTVYTLGLPVFWPRHTFRVTWVYFNSSVRCCLQTESSRLNQRQIYNFTPLHIFIRARLYSYTLDGPTENKVLMPHTQTNWHLRRPKLYKNPKLWQSRERHYRWICWRFRKDWRHSVGTQSCWAGAPPDNECVELF